MKLKPWQKIVLSALVIVVGGFLLFNTAFSLAALVSMVCNFLVGALSQTDDFALNPMFWGGLFVLIILVVSWFVLRTKWNVLVKATYLTMPLMVVLIFTGILLFEQPAWVPVAVGAAIVCAVLFFLYKKKLPWQYYFAVLYTGALALYVALAGVEI